MSWSININIATLLVVGARLAKLSNVMDNLNSNDKNEFLLDWMRA